MLRLCIFKRCSASRISKSICDLDSIYFLFIRSAIFFTVTAKGVHPSIHRKVMTAALLLKEY